LPPLSILHLDTELGWRGGQQALIVLARGLRARGHRQRIVCPPQSELARCAAAEGFEAEPLAGSRELRRLLLARAPDLLHAHSGRAQNLAALARLGLPVRGVVTRHVAFAPRNPLIHRLKYGLTCAGVIAVSEAVKSALTEAGVPAAKVEVIHTGVEVPASRPDAAARGAARERWGIPTGALAAGHMGAFTPEKGQDVAIAALERCPPELGARLILAGEGPTRAALQARAGPAVSFPGFVEDHASFFAALDLFLMPSRSEGWGLAALEAMAYGVPVIASNVGGLRELVEDGSGGWLTPPDDPEALARAIQSAAADPAALRDASEQGRRRAARFSAERTAERTETFYRRVLAARVT
jgi:glycosyltransferase involved in cell wall biosynthesis